MIEICVHKKHPVYNVYGVVKQLSTEH